MKTEEAKPPAPPKTPPPPPPPEPEPEPLDVPTVTEIHAERVADLLGKAEEEAAINSEAYDKQAADAEKVQKKIEALTEPQTAK